MGSIAIRSRRIWVKPQWDGIEIRRENDVMRSATLRYDIFSENPALELEPYEADTALGYISEPIIFGTLYRKSASIEQIAKRKWEGVVEYEYKNTGEFTFSFDTTGEKQHLTQSYGTIARFAPEGKTPPNHHGAIGVTDKGEVAGCEVIIPTLSFTMNRSREGVLDLAFIRFIAGMTGKINGTPFLSFLPGEVLFEGASGSQKMVSADNPSFDLTYKFKVSPNVEELTLRDIHIGYKRGWDYFWVQYEEYAESDNESESEDEAYAISKRPIAAFIEQVYHEAELNFLL